MCAHCTLVGVDAHEQLACPRELGDVFVVVRNEGLDGWVVAEVAEVAEDGHEALGLEREAFWIQRERQNGVLRRINNVLVVDLVREEAGNDSEETGDEFVRPDDMRRNGGDGEELEGKVFDGRFGFTVNEEIGVDYSVVDGGKMAGSKIENVSI